MRSIRMVLAVAVCLAFVGSALAQGGAPQVDPKNPVTSYVRNRTGRQMTNISAAAEAMPAEAYSFKPTDGQQPFGWVVAHIVTSNMRVCQAIGDQPAPEGLANLKPEDPK